MVGQAFQQVFSKGWYVLLAATIAILTFVLTTWLGNLSLVWQISTSQWLPLVDKAKILLALIGSIGTNFTAFSAVCAIVIAVLFGLNMSVITYSYRERRRLVGQFGSKQTIASFSGLASGIFGIGCAACGTLLLSPVLAFFGMETFVALLPFGGEEFGALGVGLLGLSLIMSAKKINQPIVCQSTIQPTFI